MLLLSPPKLLVILVIALVVLGPDKLPSAARRIGAAWSEFQRWRAHLEGEVRASFPDLPSTTEIARAVRSPIALLDRLADEHDAQQAVAPTGTSSPGTQTQPRTTPPGVPPAGTAATAEPMGNVPATVPVGTPPAPPPAPAWIAAPGSADSPVMSGGSSAN